MAHQSPERVKGIKIIRKVSGEYHYDRTLHPMKPILSTPYTPEYYKEIRDGRVDRTGLTKREGTVGFLLAKYKTTDEWGQLAPRSKRDYQKVIDYLQPLDEMPLTEITKPFLVRMRDDAFNAGNGRRAPLLHLSHPSPQHRLQCRAVARLVHEQPGRRHP